MILKTLNQRLLLWSRAVQDTQTSPKFPAKTLEYDVEFVKAAAQWRAESTGEEAPAKFLSDWGLLALSADKFTKVQVIKTMENYLKSWNREYSKLNINYSERVSIAYQPGRRLLFGAWPSLASSPAQYQPKLRGEPSGQSPFGKNRQTITDACSPGQEPVSASLEDMAQECFWVFQRWNQISMSDVSLACLFCMLYSPLG